MRLTLIVTALSITCATAQVRLWGAFGYGTYAMSDIKEIQSDFVGDFPVTPQITENFPGYWNYEIGGEKVIDSTYFVGACLGYGTTAGRVQYTDYSGSITADQLVSYVSVGIPLGLILNKNRKRYTFTFDLRPVFVFSSMSIEIASVLGGQSTKESAGFRSLNLSIQPSLGIRRKISKLILSLDAGYHVTLLGGRVFLDSNREAYLLNKKGDEVKIDWSGFRVTAGLAIVL